MMAFRRTLARWAVSKSSTNIVGLPVDPNARASMIAINQKILETAKVTTTNTQNLHVLCTPNPKRCVPERVCACVRWGDACTGGSSRWYCIQEERGGDGGVPIKVCGGQPRCEDVFVWCVCVIACVVSCWNLASVCLYALLNRGLTLAG